MFPPPLCLVKKKVDISQTDILKHVQIKPKRWLKVGKAYFFETWVNRLFDRQRMFKIIPEFHVWTIRQKPLKYNHKPSFTSWSSAFSSCFPASCVHLDRLASLANLLASQVLLSLPTLLSFSTAQAPPAFARLTGKVRNVEEKEKRWEKKRKGKCQPP